LMKNVLVVGSGGREHAIVKALKKSPQVGELYCCPGNGGISRDAVCGPVPATDIPWMLAYAKEQKIDFVVVAPDDPLAMGMADAFEEAGIPVFGPRKNAAIIESSKVFSKNFMKRHHIPTARYETFDSSAAALAYLKEQNSYPIVIKADGLALGKGAVIVQSQEEAEETIHAMMEEKKFGESGSNVVIEEFLTGPEVTVLAFTDGKTLAPMVSSMDHKRAMDGDQGLNTGGMGTIAPNPLYTPEIAAECREKIFLPTIRHMAEEGRPFKGCLYFGLMLTPDGPKVIEYNCRFGDPETQVVLSLLKTDLFTVFEAVAEERLGDIQVEWDEGAAACVIMASGGYPGGYPKGLPISGLDENGGIPGATVYHAGTAYDGQFKTAGGRVLGVTAVADDLPGALEKAYRAVEKIHFDNAHYRRDIGKRAL
jgi:phosphoribosylamine--glycine ligase